MEQEVGASLSRRNDIQGLRAIAVMGVILFHINKAWLPGGYVGVDVFLVVSGYLIAKIILMRFDRGDFSFASFYWSRFRRIVPAYAVLLSVVALVMAVFLVPADYSRFAASLESAFSFRSNNFFSDSSDYFAPLAYELPLLHTWSLAVEMQFYLLLPIILVFLPRRFVGQSLIAISIFLTLLATYYLSKGYKQAVYYSLFARIPEFLIGSLLAISGVGRDWRNGFREVVAISGLLMIVASFVFLDETSLFPGLLALPACIGVALVIASETSCVNRALSVKSLVWLGTISYSLYLWHWPILAFLRYISSEYILPLNLVVGVIALTVLAASISFYCVETPFRRGGRRIVSLGCGFLALVFCVGSSNLLSSFNSKLVPPLSVELTRYEAPENICHGQVVNNCLRGNSDEDITILLMGDSHAAQLNHFADVLGERAKVGFQVVTASGCVPISGFDVDRISEWARTACRSQMLEIKRRISSVDGVILAGKWDYHIQSRSFIYAFRQFLGRLGEQGKPVLVMGQVPHLDGHPQRIRRLNSIGLESGARYRVKPGVNPEMGNLIREFPHVDFLDLSDAGLFERVPFHGKQIIYFDSNHLNELGSKLYGEVASSYLEEWVDRKFFQELR